MKPGVLQATAVVLAGGLSRRMGADKASLDFGGVPLGLHVARRISGWFRETLVSANSEGPFAGAGFRIVRDELVDRGAPGGLASSLAAAGNPWIFAVACDMPLVARELVFLLWSLREGHDAVVPQRRGRLEPLCAFYSTACLDLLRSASREAGSLHSVFGRLRARKVDEHEWRQADPEGESFTNLNTPEDVAAALSKRRG